MLTDRIRPLLALAPAVLLGACVDDGMGINSTGPAFGEAVNQTFALQIIDPEPVYDEPMKGQGVQAGGAYERYVSDTVKQPESVRTTDVSLGSN